MSSIELGNTRISTDCAQKSRRTLLELLPKDGYKELSTHNKVCGRNNEKPSSSMSPSLPSSDMTRTLELLATYLKLRRPILNSPYVLRPRTPI